jgi:O-antigen ligase
MLAALNMGIIGTVIVIALIVAAVLFFMRRA